MIAWRAFFWAAAANNLIIGLGFFLDSAWGSSEAMAAVLIFCFGVLYGLVARDPLRFAPLLWSGIIGKVMVVAMLGPANWRASGDPAVGAIVAGDLAWALGFALFLWRHREAAKA